VSDSPLIQEIADRLRAAGYVDVATPFRVATISFDFTAALRGRGGRALDLVLLIDTTTGDYVRGSPGRTGRVGTRHVSLGHLMDRCHEVDEFKRQFVAEVTL
jgi:hypothetical protein